jgi:two-component system nitrogen regulation response regulator GlnG
MVRTQSPSARAVSGKPLLLIVDDDPLISDTLGYAFAKEFDVVTSHARPHCLALLRQLRHAPQVAVVDLGLPPQPHRPDEGFALIRDLLAHDPDMKIIVLSGQNGEDNARHARTLGAIDFVGKPCDPGRLLALLHQALAFTGRAAEPQTTAGLIGNSLPMQRLRLQLAQYAELAFPVLIEGESGSGKDIIASHCLHQETSRRQQPFLAVNCAAISPTLLEPTLFGHARGAFTGATGARSGYFEDAGEGTLFLDEIGELPPELQPKLLRVLENGEYQRVGETQTRVAKARIVAATNRDLRQEIKAGRFRADLYHRLSVFTVDVPPLREMGRDRLLLLDHFRRLYADQAGSTPFALNSAAEALWLDYAFPGNVRELRNIAIRLTARYPGQTLGPAQLAPEFDNSDPVDRDSAPHQVTGDGGQRFQAALAHLQAGERIDLDATLAGWEQSYIDAALELSGGNVSQAARRLGINRTTLYNRMEGRQR